jgi:hypothetical protein
LRLLNDSRPVSDTGTDSEFLDGEADHVFEVERARGHMNANEIAPKIQARLKVDVGKRLLDDVRVPMKGEQFPADVAQSESVEVAGYHHRPSTSRRRISALDEVVELTHAESKLRQLSRQRDDLATSEDQRK